MSDDLTAQAEAFLLGLGPTVFPAGPLRWPAVLAAYARHVLAGVTVCATCYESASSSGVAMPGCTNCNGKGWTR